MNVFGWELTLLIRCWTLSKISGGCCRVRSVIDKSEDNIMVSIFFFFLEHAKAPSNFFARGAHAHAYTMVDLLCLWSVYNVTSSTVEVFKVKMLILSCFSLRGALLPVGLFLIGFCKDRGGVVVSVVVHCRCQVAKGCR